MPLRRLLASATGLALCITTRAALGDLPKCPRHGPLRAIVAPSERDPTLARRTLDQIFSELAERTQACPASEQQPIELDVAWRPNEHVLVSVTMQTWTREISLERDVDLARVPRDGVPLAVAIVADEILAEIFDRVNAEPPPRSASPAPAPRVRSVPAAGPPSRSFRFGLRASYDLLTSGLGLAGVDVEASWIATPNFQLGFRGGLRVGSWTGAPAATSDRGWEVSPFALVTTNALDPRGVGAIVALDVIGLDGVARAAPAVGVRGWQKLGPRFVVSGDVRVGGVLSDPAEFSALSGACVTFSIGIGTEW